MPPIANSHGSQGPYFQGGSRPPSTTQCTGTFEQVIQPVPVSTTGLADQANELSEGTIWL